MLQVTLHESDEAAGATGSAGELGIEEALGDVSWAILPTPLRQFSLGRYDVSVRYFPAQTGSRVGGDWYDARLGADGSAVVAIGDVAGHGVAAAAGMARIGNALSGLSVTGQPASTLLGWLNRLVCADEVPERVASAVVCVLDQARPALRWAQAGHLPPVLVSGGEARPLPRPWGGEGGGGPQPEERQADRHNRPGGGLAGLLAAAARCQRETADDAVIALFDRLEPPATDDDVCVLAVRVN